MTKDAARDFINKQRHTPITSVVNIVAIADKHTYEGK